MRAFSKRSADSKSCIGFGIIHGGVSKNWNVNGRKPFAANLKKLVGGILRLLLFIALGTVALPFAVILSIAFIKAVGKRYFPVQPAIISISDERTINQWYWTGATAWWISAPICVLVSYLLFVNFANWYFPQKESVYILWVGDIFWVFPAIFLGMSIACFPSDLNTKVFYKERYDAMANLYDGKMQFNNRKMYYLIAIPIIALCLGIVYGGLNSYIRCTESGIYIQQFWKYGEEPHVYREVVNIQQISKITQSKNGTTSVATFIIRFNDGSEWTTSSNYQARDPSYYEPMMKYIARKSELEFKQITETIAR
ncbi:MAG: hypothetical protein HZB51_15540 [Chloroflexi bacterium]|nr:hypothetical protein [Chloroflexota bacterium]